jgi:hypothetical protein
MKTRGFEARADELRFGEAVNAGEVHGDKLIFTSR